LTGIPVTPQISFASEKDITDLKLDEEPVASTSGSTDPFITIANLNAKNPTARLYSDVESTIGIIPPQSKMVRILVPKGTEMLDPELLKVARALHKELSRAKIAYPSPVQEVSPPADSFWDWKVFGKHKYGRFNKARTELVREFGISLLNWGTPNTTQPLTWPIVCDQLRSFILKLHDIILLDMESDGQSPKAAVVSKGTGTIA